MIEFHGRWSELTFMVLVNFKMGLPRDYFAWLYQFTVNMKGNFLLYRNIYIEDENACGS